MGLEEDKLIVASEYNEFMQEFYKTTKNLEISKADFSKRDKNPENSKKVEFGKKRSFGPESRLSSQPMKVHSGNPDGSVIYGDFLDAPDGEVMG